MTNFSKRSKRMGMVALVLAMLMAQLADVSLFDIAHLDLATTHGQHMLNVSDTPPLDNVGHPSNHLSQHWFVTTIMMELSRNPSPKSAFTPAETLLNGRSDAPSTPPPLV